MKPDINSNMKPDIIIHKVDDVNCWVESENHIAYSLSDHFQFYVPGYKFMPSYKNRSWDGTIKLFQLRNREIYIGLAPYIQQFAKNNKYTCEIDNDVLTESNINEQDIFKFVDSLKLHSSGKEITAREYQKFAVFHALKKKRALLVSPTASGKSLMIYSICRALQNITKGKTLIIVPTTSLVAQMSGDFADYSSHVSWNAKDNIHEIMAGCNKNTEKQIVISTWQSMFRMSAEYLEMFDALIIDEAHLSTANSIQGICKKMTNCQFKLGFTGTLSGMKTEQLVLEGLMGKVEKVITTKKLMDNKSVAQLNIKALMLSYTDDERMLLKKAKYQDEVAWLFTHDRRTNFLAKLAFHQKENTLVMFNHISHGKAIRDIIVDMIGTKSNRKVYLVTGEMKAEERNAIRQKVENEKDSIILGSYGVFSTGISIKRIHSVIFASPTKSKIRTLQSIGRGLRVNSEKTSVVLYDIVDDLIYKSHENYAIKHFKERADFYNLEKFDFSINRINL